MSQTSASIPATARSLDDGATMEAKGRGFADAPVALLVTSEHGIVTAASDAALRLLGGDEATVVGRLAVAFADAGEQNVVAARRRAAARGDGPPEMEWVCVRSDGTRVRLRERMARTILAPDVRGCVSVLEAAAPPAESAVFPVAASVVPDGDAFARVVRERFGEAALGLAPLALFGVDAEGIIVVWDGVAKEGLAPATEVGMSCLEAWRDSDLFAHVLRALGGEAYAETYLPGDGRAYNAWFGPVRDDEGAIVGMVGLALEATEEKRSLAALHEQMGALAKDRATAQLLTHLLDAAPLALTSTDADGIIRLSRGRALAAIQLKEEDVLGQDIFASVGDPTTAETFCRALAGETVNVTTQPAPGVHFENWCLPLVDAASGALCGMNVLSLDVTARVVAEQEIREKLALIERQSTTIRSLATPIIKVWPGVLCLPVIGTVDSQRTAAMMENLLNAIVNEHAKVAILDLTGVEIVDTATADHILQLFRAAKVLGAEGILCGIRPAVAQTIVALGVDLSEIHTTRTLEGALRRFLHKSK